jgi:murein DD-endopeptidase MepM/ murein hydrolase activator NlpD
MKKIPETIRSFLSSMVSRFERRPPNIQAAQSAAAAPTQKPGGKTDRFTVISWGVTLLLVAALLGATILYKNANPPPLAPPSPVESESVDGLSVSAAPANAASDDGEFIPRHLQLKTRIPERPRYKALVYRVSRGDAMWGIADEYKLKSETILYVNRDLEDNPHNLKPGMELTIPPVDGLYYEWKDGDTFEKVAEEFDASVEDIINFPGNGIDLTDPQVSPGSVVMIPGGSRELRNWEADLVTVSRSNDGSTGTSDFGSNACGGGLVASGFGWPADAHSLSGNGYGPGHLGIDITAPEGSSVYAAGSGVVTMAQGGWNYGYGNVIQIDHGNGYVTVYAHLSQINVSACQSVGQGTLIGLSGNTGNSFGSHLHFEIRKGGTNINPYDIVQ